LLATLSKCRVQRSLAASRRFSYDSPPRADRNPRSNTSPVVAALLTISTPAHSMLLEFEVGRCTRRCAATDREIAPGETCYSLLKVEGADVVRVDLCSEAWTAAPQSALGWWKTIVPQPAAKKIKLAPNDVLLELFDELADRNEQQDLRYVLALLLIRRRVLRLDLPVAPLGAASLTTFANADDAMVVYCPKRDASYTVLATMPSPERIDEIQRQLSELLVAGAD
jgi:hypothetical protein